MTPHHAPYLTPFDDEDAAAIAFARYRAGLERAARQRPTPTPPVEHVRLFLRSALWTGAVVVVLIVCAWIGGVR